MINRSFSYSENKVLVKRKVIAEYFQYGRRFYTIIDPANPKREIPALADEIDKRFKTVPGKIKPRHAKR